MLPHLHAADRAPRRVRACLAAALLIAALPCAAGRFAVSPLRTEIAAGARSTLITLRNDDSVPLRFQVDAVRWDQDDDGGEVYAPAPELVWFPRLLTVQPGREAAVRIGLSEPSREAERSWRVFIQELPPLAPVSRDDADAPPQGSTVRLQVLIGAALFAPAAQGRPRLVLGEALRSNGALAITVHNQGRRHAGLQEVQVRAFDADGAAVLQQSWNDRYLLASRSRVFRITPDAQSCPRIARLLFTLQADGRQLRREFEVDASGCP